MSFFTSAWKVVKKGRLIVDIIDGAIQAVGAVLGKESKK